MALKLQVVKTTILPSVEGASVLLSVSLFQHGPIQDVAELSVNAVAAAIAALRCITIKRITTAMW